MAECSQLSISAAAATALSFAGRTGDLRRDIRGEAIAHMVYLDERESPDDKSRA